MTKLASKLPTDTDNNGLNALRRQLVNDPTREHVIVAVIDCSKTETDTDTGHVEPTVRLIRVEAVMDSDTTDARAMLHRALAKRTGRTVGFDLRTASGVIGDVRVIGDDDVDTATGEVRTG